MNLAGYIDHTCLKADMADDELDNFINEAKTYSFAAVCVNPIYVARCADALKGTEVKVATVIGFPLGESTTAVKKYETAEAVKNGADEIDMVMTCSRFKALDYEYVRNDISEVVEAASGRTVKVIIETSRLSDYEIIKACEICMQAGANFVKTSTGFMGEGATVHNVELMRKTVGERLGVKAAGGIRDYIAAKAMIEAGATRIGTSAGVKILIEDKRNKNN